MNHANNMVDSTPPHDRDAQTWPIPARLNLCLVAVVFSASIFLLVAASHCESIVAKLGVGILFSYALLTNYALIHEATHHNLHPNPRINYLLGVLTGMLFPIPFSMIHITHQNHHARNRTDSEMFDLFYPTDNLLRKRVQWYGILLGFFWPLVPIGAVLFSFGPRALQDRIIESRRLTGGYLMGELRGRVVHWIRLELLLIVMFFTLLIWLFELRWQSVLLCYACFSFNWSTRQYIGHAFAQRHVIEGSWNLKHGPVMTWVLLHGEYDLNHHRRPDVSWLHLPKLSPPDEKRPSYLRQYWRQWLGPRPATEPPAQELPPHHS